MSDIWFAEVPCFYAEVERVRDPLLRDRPVIVGGDPRKRGRVQSATAEAQAAGVEVGMDLLRALDRCPQARAVRTDMEHYREISGRLRACFRDGAVAIEPLGLEAAFIQPDPSAALGADRLRERVHQSLGLPLRVGIAGIKFLARLAAEDSGAEGVLRVPAGAESDFLRPLPTSRLPGVGPRTVSALFELGVECVGDLLKLDEVELESRLGNHGLRILEFARAEDHSVVESRQTRQSLSREITFATAEADRGVLDQHIERLSREIVSRLDREGWIGHRVSLRVAFAGGGTNTRSRTLGRPVEGPVDLASLGKALIGLTQAGSRPVRRLGLAVARLVPAGQRDRQLDLFGTP